MKILIRQLAKKTIHIFFLTAIFIFLPCFVLASSTDGVIDPTYKYAWNENAGLINFGATQGNVHITDSGLTGYAWSENTGWINLNPTNSGVANDGAGNLSGYGWSENMGWINFAPTNGGVTIDSNGQFSGTAFGESIGWIFFNDTYKVKTDWRPQNVRPACNNALDDDSDGLVDYPSDLGCESLTDDNEINPSGLPPTIYNPPTPSAETPILKEEASTATEKAEKAVETISTKAKEFAEKIITIADEAVELIKANINSLLAKLGIKRDLAKEVQGVGKYVKNLIKDATVTKDQQSALTNFVTYGTNTTLSLGEGERAGVVNSYKSAFGKLPSAENEWSDAVKIANGRWPSETSATSEANAVASFKKIYLREPDRTNSHDDAAVVVMAYGLRPAGRNLESEKAAIKIFESIYKYSPTSAVDWDAVRAIAYSGATK